MGNEIPLSRKLIGVFRKIRQRQQSRLEMGKWVGKLRY